MVYKWKAHRQTCYQLYIEEGKSLEEIMEYMKRVHDFAPSKRAFQVQFHHWKFPSKQNPAYKNEELVARIRELWEKNLTQREMLQVLNHEEGFNIKSRELMRVRSRYKLLLRAANGDRSRNEDPSEQGANDQEPNLSEADEVERAITSQLAESSRQDHSLQMTEDAMPEATRPTRRRRGRLVQAVDGSSAVVRFPSEMPGEEARITLGLEMSVYRDVRATFQRICQEECVIKKTLVGPDRWEAIKARLVRSSPHLQEAMWKNKDDLETKKVALDVICTEVTKRIRSNGTRMALADAKNILGFNPEETRNARAVFYQVFREAGFTCKSDATPQQWKDLKEKWGERSELVKKIVDEFRDADEMEAKPRALEVLAKDVIKRARDEKAYDKSKKNQQSVKPKTTKPKQKTSDGFVEARFAAKQDDMGEAQATEQIDLGDDMAGSNFDDISEVSETAPILFASPNPPMASHMSMPLQTQPSGLPHTANRVPQNARVLGPAMAGGVPLGAPMGPSILLAANAHTDFMNGSYAQEHYVAPAPPPVYAQAPSVPATFAAYLRLHPSSRVVTNTNFWIATLSSASLHELRQTATQNFPNTVCLRVEGILKDGKGGEIPLPIEQDQEMSAYLAHLQGAAPTFSVQLWKTS